MALAPWNVLASGKIRTNEEEERRRQTGEEGRRRQTVKMAGLSRSSLKIGSVMKRKKRFVKPLRKSPRKSELNILPPVYILLKYYSTLADVSSSRHCISHAEDTICLPDCRRSKGGTFAGQYRGIGNHVEQRSDQIFGKCGFIWTRISILGDCELSFIFLCSFFLWSFHDSLFVFLHRAMAKRMSACSPLVPESLKGHYFNPSDLEIYLEQQSQVKGT